MYHYVSAEEALSIVQSNQRIFLHGSACTPNFLISELAKQSHRLKNVEIVSITLQGEVEIAKPEYKENFYINSFFVSTFIFFSYLNYKEKRRIDQYSIHLVNGSNSNKSEKP